MSERCWININYAWWEAWEVQQEKLLDTHTKHKTEHSIRLWIQDLRYVNKIKLENITEKEDARLGMLLLWNSKSYSGWLKLTLKRKETNSSSLLLRMSSFSMSSLPLTSKCHIRRESSEARKIGNSVIYINYVFSFLSSRQKLPSDMISKQHEEGEESSIKKMLPEKFIRRLFDNFHPRLYLHTFLLCWLDGC